MNKAEGFAGLLICTTILELSPLSLVPWSFFVVAIIIYMKKVVMARNKCIVSRVAVLFS